MCDKLRSKFFEQETTSMNTTSSRWVWLTVFTVSAGTGLLLLGHLKGIATIPFLPDGSSDTGWVSKSIVLVFAATLVVNARNTWGLFREFSQVRAGLRSDPTTSEMRLVGNGLLGTHASRMYQIYDNNYDGDVSQSVSLGTIRSGLYGQEWIVRHSSQLLLCWRFYSATLSPSLATLVAVDWNGLFTFTIRSPRATHVG